MAQRRPPRIPRAPRLLWSIRNSLQYAKRLGTETGHIALLGSFGSGKSSVISLMKATIIESGEKFWVANVSCWGLDDGSKIQQAILRAAVDEVSQHIDVFGFRSIPEEYTKAVEGAEKWHGIFRRLLPGYKSPADILKELARLVEATGRKLVIVVEDADRERSHLDGLAVLLAQLRDTKGISFVLAVEETAPIDLAKVCHFIEYVPRLHYKDAVTALNRVRDLMLSNETKKGDWPDEDMPRFTDAQAWRIFPEYGTISWPKACVEILNTPRQLKMALRRANGVWGGLHGEVHPDDVLATTALRQGCPEAFNFLVSESGALLDLGQAVKSQNGSDNRIAADSVTTLSQRLKKVWMDLPLSARLRRCSDALIGHLLPSTCWIGEGAGSDEDRFIEREPVLRELLRSSVDEDGFFLRRLLGESLAGTPRLQPLLRSIKDLLTSEKGAEAVVQSLQGDNRLLSWLRKSMPLAPPKAWRRVLEVLHTKLRQTGVIPTRRAEDEVFRTVMAIYCYLWRGSDEEGDEFEPWLKRELERCLPSHLALLAELYHQWTAIRQSIPMPSSEWQPFRARMRRWLISRVTAFLRSTDPHEVAPGFSLANPRTLQRLIIHSWPDSTPMNPGSTGYDPVALARDWVEAGEFIARIANLYPDLVLPDVINLISRGGTHLVDGPGGREVEVPYYRFDENVANSLFGERTSQMLSLIASTEQRENWPDKEKIVFRLRRNVRIDLMN